MGQKVAYPYVDGKIRRDFGNRKKYANNIIFEDLDPALVNELAGKFLPFRCPEKNLPCNK